MAWFGHASQICIEDDGFMMFMAYICLYIYIYIMMPSRNDSSTWKKRCLEDPHGSFLGHLFRNQIRPTADLTIKCGVLEGIPNSKSGLNIWDMMNYHLGGAFKYFLFSPYLEDSPFYLIFFRWVETTNQSWNFTAVQFLFLQAHSNVFFDCLAIYGVLPYYSIMYGPFGIFSGGQLPNVSFLKASQNIGWPPNTSKLQKTKTNLKRSFPQKTPQYFEGVNPKKRIPTKTIKNSQKPMPFTQPPTTQRRPTAPSSEQGKLRLREQQCDPSSFQSSAPFRCLGGGIPRFGGGFLGRMVGGKGGKLTGCGGALMNGTHRYWRNVENANLW